MVAFSLPAGIALAGAGILVMAITGVFNGSSPSGASFVQGEIDGDRYDITSKFTARVEKENVTEGQKVAAGDLVLTLNGDEILEKLSQTKEALEEAKAALTKLENGTRSEDLRTLEANLKSATASRIRAYGSYERYSSLYQKHVISKDSYDESVKTLSQATETEAAAKAALDKGKNGARYEDLDAARASVRRLQAQYKETLSISKDRTLLAPCEGEVEKIIVKRGELATAGYPLASVINLNDLWASVMLREDQMRKIRLGSRISGKIPALSDDEYLFEIYYIAPQGNYATWRAANNSGSFDLKTFEVRSKPVKRIEGLRPGMSIVFDYPFKSN